MEERRAFMSAALQTEPTVETFCLALAYTGARISELLAATPRRFDFSMTGIRLRTLKRRRPDVFRTVPIPDWLMRRLDQVHGIRQRQIDLVQRDARIWPWCRTTAWTKVKKVMRISGVSGACAMPKGLRHGLAVESTVEAGVPLNIVQKWLGHARIETTAKYADAIGKEERILAARLWNCGAGGLP